MALLRRQVRIAVADIVGRRRNAERIKKTDARTVQAHIVADADI